MTVGFSVHDLKLQGGAIATELCFSTWEWKDVVPMIKPQSPPVPGNAENVDLKIFEFNRN